MRKGLRRAAAVVLVVAVALLAIGFATDRPATTGQWLVRANLQPKTRHIGRFDVRYVRKGQGPTVILIHGLASSIYTWSGVINLLAEKFDVVALDLPGFGESSQPADLTFAEYVPTVLGLMKELGIEKAHFVGNSMGGAVSLAMAAREPARVDRLVLLDSAGVNMAQGDRPFIVRFLGSKSASILASALPVRRALTRATLRHLMHDQTRVTDERVDEYSTPLMRPGALDATRALLVSRLDGGSLPDLGLVRAPTLVIWGRFDPWIPLAQADEFIATIRGSRKVILETGHMPQEEQPEDVARIVGEFLLS